jgi:hypothetical protein
MKYSIGFLLAFLYGSQVMAQDSALTHTLKSALYSVSSKHGTQIFLGGKPASDEELKAACLRYENSALVYGHYEKRMSHQMAEIKIFLIGEAAALTISPLFTQPSIYKNNYWQAGIITLALGSFLYFLSWEFISHSRLERCIHLYNHSLFAQAGIPTHDMETRIKDYYQDAFHFY